MKYLDPNTGLYFGAVEPRLNTKQVLAFFQFKNDAGDVINWTLGQLEIIDCILNRSSPDGKKRIEINCSTQYGKSIAVAAALVIRASLYPEKWAIVAGTDDKAKIIMEYVVMFSLNNEIVRSQLTADTPLDRLRMKKSSDRMTFKRKGEIRVFSAGATLVNQTSKALMGFGCIPKGFKVLTDIGEIEISDLVKNKQTDKVYSYNHKTNKIELQKILDYQDNPLGNRDIYEIDLGDKKFRCTEDHPVWVEGKGYIKAKDIQKGDEVWVMD